MKKRLCFLTGGGLFLTGLANAQVPVLSHSINAFGQVELEIAASPDHYYVLHVRPKPGGDFKFATSLAVGKIGQTILSEPLAAWPIDHYQVTEHLVAAPADTDGDGQNDLEEWNARPIKSPFNAAKTIDTINGQQFLADRAAFESLSFRGNPAFQVPGLAGLEVVKFFILNKDAAWPQLWFLHPKMDSHTQFVQAIGEAGNPSFMSGLLLFHPDVVAPNGKLGTYRFNFQPNNLHTFQHVEKVAELLAANAPFLKNNLCFYPYPGTSLPLYFQEKALFDASRVCVLFEDDIYGNLHYQPLHLAEGCGLLRKMAPGETPGPRDLVIYESLPNVLPRVGGIVTTVPQTPLSHVNLRAIQDNLPNAFIRDALQKPEIAGLLGQYLFYKVAADTFSLRPASLAEVDSFFAARRPAVPLVPVRDLSQTRIRPLDNIEFSESASFGVKCVNVATMRGFGFPDGTIPDGFGIPFFFYDEFMRFNGFYAEVQAMLDDPVFQANAVVQQQKLTNFRQKIKAAPMPNWMLDSLAQMQQTFGPGASIRCRSSTNNEDLPGFSGAGLYDSFTQHPAEGHISKSIRQVFAGMWNYRAFDEREFYRVNHFQAAMGVLVHLNSENEIANGVAVSIDPIYGSKGTFYLNTQVGENLVTNPAALSIPEEILLDTLAGHAVMQPSNAVPPDSLLLSEAQFDQLRDHLGTIHRRFKGLYRAENAPDFAMEIEFKITDSGRLFIKQARPWADFWAGIEPPPAPADSIEIDIFPNPFGDFLRLKAPPGSDLDVRIFNSPGQLVRRERLFFEGEFMEISTGLLPGGVYFVEILNRKTGWRMVRMVVK